MEYGVMSVPALVVNNKVVSTGKVLKTENVQKLLQKSFPKINLISNLRLIINNSNSDLMLCKTTKLPNVGR